MGILFGTDGIRGIANQDLTPELAMSVGRAAAAVLSADNRRHPKFVIGSDTRLSSGMLASAAIAGLCSVGADVIDLGVVPTPAVAYLVGKYKADAGIMISASHNPFEYNGLKIFSGDGYKLPDALEEEIENIITGNSHRHPQMTAADVGRVNRAENAVKDYVAHLKCTVPYSLDGMEIAVDCANGSASATAERLFTELGANCHMLFHEPNGTNINDGCGSTHPEALCAYVKENHLDAGCAFDGDADRCFCVDDQGNLIDGDNIMAILAPDMKMRGKLAKNTIVGTIMTNLGFVKFCEENGIDFAATKVGDRYVLEQMLLEDFNFGGEQSGHIIFRDFATTGDGQLTAIQLLSQIRRTGQKQPAEHDGSSFSAVPDPRGSSRTDPDQIIQRRHSQKQQHILRLRAGIQQDASRKKRHIPVPGRRQIKRRKKNGQEPEQEFQTAEYQTIFSHQSSQFQTCHVFSLRFLMPYFFRVWFSSVGLPFPYSLISIIHFQRKKKRNPSYFFNFIIS